MKQTLIIIIMLIFSSVTWAEKVIEMPDIMKATYLQVDDSQLYIVEDATVFIYSLKDFKLIKKFGKEGQGPGEFALIPQLPLIVDVSTEDIIVNSFGKLSHFTKDGTFKNEIKTTSQSFVFQPMGKDRFIGLGTAMDKNVIYNTINFYDGTLNKIKEIYRVDSGIRGGGQGAMVVKKAAWFQYYENKIYLPGDSDDTIDVFDIDMNKLYTIEVKAKKRKITDEFKKNAIHHLKTSRQTKDIYEIFLKPVRFPDYFPTVLSFFGVDNTLYVMTWLRENEQNEFYTYDMKGKFIKKLYLPLAYQTYLQPFPLTVRNQKLYQIVENIDNEVWELHISDIN